jgi:hypothetical protein
MKKILIAVVALMWLIGCSDFREIPAGYVGKILTPSGWQKGVLEAGQVDIGAKKANGSYTALVLLEATSISEKEPFDANTNGEDHRILIGKTPVAVDVYVRMSIPQEQDKRDALFALITAKPSGNRISIITIKDIYERFAKMDIRSGIRSVLQKEDSINAIIKNLDKFNNKLGDMAIQMFERSGTPLIVQNVTISNVKMDASIWEAENQKAAALAQVEVINKVGTALRANPEYLLIRKYDTYEKIKDKIGNFTIIEGNPGGIVIK